MIANYINDEHNLSIVVNLGDSRFLITFGISRSLKNVSDRHLMQTILYLFSSNPDTKSRSQRTSFSRA